MDQHPYLNAPSARWVSHGPWQRQGIDQVDPVRHRLLARLGQQQALREILGTYIFDTNILIGAHGEWIGECWYGTKKLSFSLWAPHKRILADIFPKELPDEDELLARDAFAAAHRLRYLVVPPGHTFGIEELKEILQEAA